MTSDAAENKFQWKEQLSQIFLRNEVNQELHYPFLMHEYQGNLSQEIKNAEAGSQNS
jgi:hypothetical protein